MRCDAYTLLMNWKNGKVVSDLLASGSFEAAARAYFLCCEYGQPALGLSLWTRKAGWRLAP